MHSRRGTRLAAIGGAALQALACAGDEPAYSGPLCPDCVAVGGETGDFPGGGVAASPPCPRQESVVADAGLALPSGLTARAAIDLVQREVQLPASWQKTPFYGILDNIEGISGFSSNTDIRLQILVTGVASVDIVPDDPQQSCEGQGPSCAPLSEYSPAVQAACGGLDLTASVALSTGDGAIAGTFEGAIVHVYSETDAALSVRGDISQFSGRLRLGSRKGDGLLAGLDLVFNADGVRGKLAPVVVLTGTSDYGSEDSAPAPYSYGPLELYWPGTDACSWDAFPYTGQDARERAEETVALFSSGSTYTAVYFKPTTDLEAHLDADGVTRGPPMLGATQMTLEVDTPPSVCQGRGGGSVRSPLQYQEFELPAHFVSSDGRYDLSVPLHVSGVLSPDHSDGIGYGEFQSAPLPIDEFQTRFGIGPLDFGDLPCAALRVAYAVDAGRQFSKLIQVDGLGCPGVAPRSPARVVELLGLEEP